MRAGCSSAPPSLAPFAVRTFWQVFTKGKRGSAAVGICPFSSASICTVTAIARLSPKQPSAAESGLLGQKDSPQPETPGILVTFFLEEHNKDIQKSKLETEILFPQSLQVNYRTPHSKPRFGRGAEPALVGENPAFKEGYLVSQLKPSSNFQQL